MLAATAILSLAVSCQELDYRDVIYPMQVVGRQGTLDINSRNLYLKEGKASLIARYRNDEGLCVPREIMVTPGEDVGVRLDGDYAIFQFKVPGSYTVSAESISISITVNNWD